MQLGKILHLLEKANNLINGVVVRVGSWVLVVMMCLTVADVFLRYVFNAPILGSSELVELMMALVVSFGLAYTLLKEGHVRVTLVVSRFPERVQVIIESITSLLCLGLFSLIAWQGIVQAKELWTTNLTSASLFVPIWPFVLMVTLGSILLSLVLLANLLQSLAKVIERSRWDILIWVLIGGPLCACAVWLRNLVSVSPLTAGFISLVVLFVLLFSRMPIAFAITMVGFIGMTYLSGLDAGLGLLATVPYSTIASYPFSVVPLFILLGSFAYYSGLTHDLYKMAYKWLGHLPGGLAMATTVACAGFAATSGSSIAGAATMSTVALPEMKRYKYAPSLATACVAAGGTLGILIPPSVVLVIVGILTGQSIGKLLIAGIFPGILLTTLFMLVIYIRCRMNIELGPPAPSTGFREKIGSLKGVWPVLGLFVLMMGGLYTGIFTPTEAAAVGAFGALLLLGSRGRLTWKNFSASLIATLETTAMVMMLLVGGMTYSYFLTITKLSVALADFLSGLLLPPVLVLAVVLTMYLFLGCVMDSLSMIIITLPVFFPLLMALGFDPILLGILVVISVEMGQITPPVGINVFVVAGVDRDTPLYTIFRGITPFVVAMAICVILLIAFPQIALFLSNLELYK
jgi:tripartite ATP-independent transporter DctM subunit